MKRMLKIMLVLLALAMLGCDSSKSTVRLPFPYTSFIVRFKSLYENETPSFILFGMVSVRNNRTGEYREVFHDEELRDGFFKKDTEYEITWRLREAGTTNIQQYTHPSYKLNPQRDAVVLLLGKNDYEIIPN